MKVDKPSTNVPALGEKGLASTLLPSNHLDAIDQTKILPFMAIITEDQPDATIKDGPTFSGTVA